MFTTLFHNMPINTKNDYSNKKMQSTWLKRSTQESSSCHVLNDETANVQYDDLWQRL